MIRTHDICMDISGFNLILYKIGCQNIIQTPSGIILTCIKTIRPPGIFNFIRMHISERIRKTRIQKFCELATLFRCKAGILHIGLRILYIHRCCGNIKITADNNRFFRFSRLFV